jgi:predicted dinucleotide-binding enzyme
MKQRIAFIGGGNMGRSLIGGLISKGVSASQIVVADPYAPTLQALKTDYNVATVSNNTEAVRDADVVLLAVKPQEMRNVVTGIQAQLLQHRPFLISIAAGRYPTLGGRHRRRALHAQSSSFARLRRDCFVRDRFRAGGQPHTRRRNPRRGRRDVVGRA